MRKIIVLIIVMIYGCKSEECYCNLVNEKSLLNKGVEVVYKGEVTVLDEKNRIVVDGDFKGDSGYVSRNLGNMVIVYIESTENIKHFKCGDTLKVGNGNYFEIDTLRKDLQNDIDNLIENAK